MKSKYKIIFAISLFIFLSSFNTLTTFAASVNTVTSAGIVKLSSGVLNVRASASTNSTILSTLKNGTYVSVVSQNENFYKVLYAPNKIGYCHKNYINILHDSYAAYVNTSSTNLNVRSGPGTSYNIKDSLYKSEKIVVISSNGNFSKILYDATSTGYVASKYIKALNSSNNISTPDNITLNIPNFKQYDNKWSNVRLGNSAHTILKSGCLTTAVAMQRSFYRGYEITPAKVATTEKYTSAGSLYWPKEYSFIYTNNLNTFKQLLNDRIPIIVGSKNSYGSQHWVIITGYKKNGSLTADDFTINDPGSEKRKTLGAFYDVYPIFYKAAYTKP